MYWLLEDFMKGFHRFRKLCTSLRLPFSEMIYSGLTLLALCASANGKTYFKEDFNDKSWESRWTVSSEWKSKVCMKKLTTLLHFLLF